MTADTDLAIEQPTARPRLRSLQHSAVALVRTVVPRRLWYDAAVWLERFTGPLATHAPGDLDTNRAVYGVRAWIQALSAQGDTVPVPPVAPAVEIVDALGTGRPVILCSVHLVANLWFIRWLHDRGWQIAAIARPQPARILGTDTELSFLPADSNAFVHARRWLRGNRRVLLVFLDNVVETVACGRRRIKARSRTFAFAQRTGTPMLFFRSDAGSLHDVTVDGTAAPDSSLDRHSYAAECKRRFETLMRRGGLPPIEWDTPGLQ